MTCDAVKNVQSLILKIIKKRESWCAAVKNWLFVKIRIGNSRAFFRLKNAIRA